MLPKFALSYSSQNTHTKTQNNAVFRMLRVFNIQLNFHNLTSSKVHHVGPQTDIFSNFVVTEFFNSPPIFLRQSSVSLICKCLLIVGYMYYNASFTTSFTVKFEICTISSDNFSVHEK